MPLELGPVGVLARMTFNVDVWLGGDRGGRSLPKHIAAWLSDSYKAKVPVWSDSDIPKDDVVLGKLQSEMWMDIIDDSASTVGDKATKTDKRRLLYWLDPVGSCATEDVVSAYVQSPQCLQDMAAQGAKSYWDLVFTELSLVIGRPATQA